MDSVQGTPSPKKKTHMDGMQRDVGHISIMFLEVPVTTYPYKS